MTEPNKPEDAPPGAGEDARKRPDDDTRDDAASTEAETGEEPSHTDGDTAGAEAKPDELAAEEPAVMGGSDAPDLPDTPDARAHDETTQEEGEAARAADASDGADRPHEAEDAPAETGAETGLRAVSHDPRTGGQDAGETPGTAGDAAESPPPEPEPVASEAAAPATAAAEAPAGEKVVVERRGGVIPGFLGGVIAVAGAAFAAPYVLPDAMRPVMSLEPVEARLAEQSDEMETMAGRLDEAIGALEGAPSQADLSALSERVAALESDLSARLDDLSSRIAALQTTDDELATRIEEAERAPLEDATDPAVVAALESYGREVEALRAEVQRQTEENQRLIEEAAAATAEARAAAEAEAQAAAERAAMAARQQALVDVQAALDAGQPFAEPLAELSDMEIPAALSAVADAGVPTLAALQADFPGAAREALDAARRANAGDDPGDRALTFLQSQLGVRSLEPREGDSADAILSRAQAAAQNGDLSTAVEELQALPEPALAAMQGWIDRARTRAEATDAADQLAASLATN
ncbi:hypothetical protein DLJ49_02005 [Rhodovulum sp. 12E13]|uniref:COG4223 family protein n=1 Tax=Rhodovulum sp. 12E13 TaxID=2203891 RepID=UPI000E130948|nr:hypothetical protein [Rhodovulum sp. 12E13]RDC74779.1 hypothetical protein DLJ49_02005 [Rhodovulum sp. 12E13]